MRYLKGSSILVAVCLMPLASSQTPIAWWKFDEASGSTASATVGGIDGSLSGSATFASGISGNALQLSSAGGSYASFGNNFGLIATSYSISFWVNSTTTTSDQIILGKHRATFVSGHFVGMGANGPYGAANKAWAYQSSFPGNQPISTTSINDGSWHHVVVTYNIGSGSHTIYVDGAPAESSTIAAGMGVAAADFMVGGIFTSGGAAVSTFTGMVDDLQIYGEVLSDGHINYLFNNPGSAVPEPATMTALLVGGLSVLRRRKRA